jgi:hypothetical protein
MNNKSFLDDEWVFKQYQFWIHSPTVGEHWADKQRLYHFVISCVNYVKDIKFVKKEEAWKRINLDILKEHLMKDIASIWGDTESIVPKMLVQFEELLEYEKERQRWKGYKLPANFPDHRSE